MTKVTEIYGSITIDGHAGMAKRGEDMACAVVSVLFETLINSITDIAGDKIEVEERDGYRRIVYEELTEAGMLFVYSFLIGIIGVANEYPDYVELTTDSRRAINGITVEEKKNEIQEH